MRKLTMPTDNPSKVFLACISIVKDDVLKARLTSVEPNIVASAEEFRKAASGAMLHTLPPQNDVGGVVTKNEMSDVYALRMVKKGTPGRPIYDRLLASPMHGRCPLCGQRTVSTLDHHLAKAYYPALAVVPANLVPACADCNRVKLDTIPQAAEEQTVNPYFDDVEDEPWLRAKVIAIAPATLYFFVDAPGN